jgi:hypothetical protein
MSEEVLIIKNNTSKSPKKNNGGDPEIKNEKNDIILINPKLNSTLGGEKKKKDKKEVNLVKVDTKEVPSDANCRKDHYGVEIKKKGKHKLTWIDWVNKSKKVEDVTKIESYKFQVNIDKEPVSSAEPVSTPSSKSRSFEHNNNNEEKVGCCVAGGNKACIIF